MALITDWPTRVRYPPSDLRARRCSHLSGLSEHLLETPLSICPSGPALFSLRLMLVGHSSVKQHTSRAQASSLREQSGTHDHTERQRCASHSSLQGRTVRSLLSRQSRCDSDQGTMMHFNTALWNTIGERCSALCVAVGCRYHFSAAPRSPALRIAVLTSPSDFASSTYFRT